MTESLHSALIVLLIGMITVFVVLSLVVLTGKLLIYLVNEFGPAQKKSLKSSHDFNPLLTDKIKPSTYIKKEKPCIADSDTLGWRYC